MLSRLALLFGAIQATTALTIPRNAIQTQQLIVSLTNEVTFLAKDYVSSDQPIAREVLVTIQSELAQLGPQVTPINTTCPIQSYAPITKLGQAVTTLNHTATYLLEILAGLPYTRTEQGVVTQAYCNANASVAELQDYTYSDAGQTFAVTPRIAERYTLIALDALQAAVGTTEDGQAATDAAKIAYNNTQAAVGTFAAAEGISGPYSCPLDQVQPANGSAQAFQYAEYLHDQVVPQTFRNGRGIVSGFCEIGFYLSAIDHYVQA